MSHLTLSLVEAAQLLKVHPKTLQKLAQRGHLPACKVGRAWVFVEGLLIDHGHNRSRVCPWSIFRRKLNVALQTQGLTVLVGQTTAHPE